VRSVIPLWLAMAQVLEIPRVEPGRARTSVRFGGSAPPCRSFSLPLDGARSPDPCSPSACGRAAPRPCARPEHRGVMSRRSCVCERSRIDVDVTFCLRMLRRRWRSPCSSGPRRSLSRKTVLGASLRIGCVVGLIPGPPRFLYWFDATIARSSGRGPSSGSVFRACWRLQTGSFSRVHERLTSGISPSSTWCGRSSVRRGRRCCSTVTSLSLSRRAGSRQSLMPPVWPHRCGSSSQGRPADGAVGAHPFLGPV